MKNIYKNKRVVIMGLGLHGGGAGVAEFFAKQGAKVLVTDLKTEEQLEKSLKRLKKYKIDYYLGGHRDDDFKNADLIIKNPAVPNNNRYLKIAKRNKVKIDSDVNIFLRLCKADVIGITGTKGKSTVATLIWHILKTKYPSAILAGNIGVSPLEYLDKKASKVVLELSSFELEDIKKSPKIAVITALMPDHFDRYKNFSNYLKAKKNIFKFQKKNDILILNYNDRKIAQSAKSRIIFYSKDLVKDNVIYFNNKPICDIKDLKIYGEHNVLNVLAAITAVKQLGISDIQIKNAIKSFKGVPSRQEFVKEINGVKYFNDTTATMPDATIEAIKTFKGRFPDSRLILIAGGQDKGLEYGKLAKEINTQVDSLILLPGTGSDKLVKDLTIQPIKVDSMPSAVAKAKEISKSGDIVVLSPAGASFNLFKNEFDRGDRFKEEVKKK